MYRKLWQQRPLLTIPQIIALLVVLASLFIALDLNRRARAGELVGGDETIIQNELNIEITRQVELQATLEYVQSEDYVAAYARDEGGYLLPGEKRVVPLVIEVEIEETAVSLPTSDPAQQAMPWQAWWRLVTDAPYPKR